MMNNLNTSISFERRRERSNSDYNNNIFSAGINNIGNTGYTSFRNPFNNNLNNS